MPQPCQDNYFSQFHSLTDILDYHKRQARESRWARTEVSTLSVAPLDKSSPLYSDHTTFAPGISEDAIKDTASHLGLALRLEGAYYPVRDTAYKSLLDRAKISGSALPKLEREELANILNSCLKLHKTQDALLLIRDEKVAAVHSGDERDYAVLQIDKLMESMQSKLDERFSGNAFDTGYSDHSLTSAAWSLPDQRDELLETYQKTLAAQGKGALAAKLTPAVRFGTSDTGISSAKVSAMLTGLQHPIDIGGCVAVEHRGQATIEDFQKSLDMIFARFRESIALLEKIAMITLDYPVNAMTRVCKKLSMPKKAAIEAIGMFEVAYGGGAATAHDVFMGMQEIMFIMKSEGTPESKMQTLAENLARALTLHWPDYDLAKSVEY